ncbi:hypothetical protein ACFLFF_09620 [Brevibacillus reuszeri]|uniref:hypothetical protein n=1 Tax=Brevibacillus reuszeri TaxID=54915 RepID=UPI00366B5F55
MQETNTLDEFELFINRTNNLCIKLGMKWENYSTPEELFQAVANKFPVKALLLADERIEDECMQDDFLGMMYRPIRDRIQEAGLPVEEGAWSA